MDCKRNNRGPEAKRSVFVRGDCMALTLTSPPKCECSRVYPYGRPRMSEVDVSTIMHITDSRGDPELHSRS